MLKRRKRTTESSDVATEAVSRPPDVEDVPDVKGLRAAGPWDLSEKKPINDGSYIDLGSLIVRGRIGVNIQLPQDADGEVNRAAVLLTEDAGLELRAFADARSGGLWESIRENLVEEVQRLDGESEVVDGVFGTELRFTVPVTLPDQEAGFQPSRVIGIEGPRWFLRATFLGKAALEPADDGILMECLRDTIVNRGAAPMAPREPLPLTVPTGAIVESGSDEV